MNPHSLLTVFVPLQIAPRPRSLRGLHGVLLWAWMACAGTAWLGAAEPAGVTYQVRVLNEKEVGLDGRVRIGAYGDFGKRVVSALTNDAPSIRHTLRLHLNGIGMTNLPVGIETPTPNIPDHPAVVLVFQLVRNSNDDGNRGSWNHLFRTVGFTTDNRHPLEVSVSLANGIEQHAEGLLTFRVASTASVLAVVVTGFAIFVFLMRYAINSSMLRESGIASPYSLGRVQMAFWGLLVLVCFFGVWAVNLSMERIPGQVLILLGISATTGLSALFIGQSNQAGKGLETLQSARTKLQGEIEKLRMPEPVTDDKKNVISAWSALEAEIGKAITSAAMMDANDEKRSEGFWKDIVSDQTGPTFSRFQVVLWTGVLGIVFIFSVATSISMPEFEQTLLILMGISNGTYLGFKTRE